MSVIRRIVLLAVAAATAMLVAPTPAQAGGTALRPVNLGTLRGFCCSQATALNDRGDVVGHSQIADGENAPIHAFRWRAGHLRDLGTLGGPNSFATAINNHGDVVGFSDRANGGTHAFLWRDGHLRDLGSLGGDSIATGINDRGEIVGWFVTADFQVQGFLWRDGVMRRLVDANGVGLLALGVNEHTAVVGALGPSGAESPAVWRGGVVTVIDPRNGQGNAINDRGDTVGSLFDGTQQAYLSCAGTVRLLPTIAGATVTIAAGINNRRDIVGSALGTGTRPVLWPEAGAPRVLRGLGGGDGAAAGVNRSGQVAGWSTLPNGEIRAVLWTR